MSKINRNQKIAIIIDIIIRLIGPLYVFVNPVWGCVISVILDGIDYEPLVRGLGLKKRTYDLLDKTLDFYWYILILIFALTRIQQPFVVMIISVTFIYRLLGTLLLHGGKEDRILIYFPNLIEPFFWIYLLFPSVFEKNILFVIVLVVVFCLKIKNEIMLHRDGYNTLDSIRNVWRKFRKY